MLRKKNRQPKPRLPTVDEFLEFIPRRLDFEWETKEDGLVTMKVPKFTSNFGKSFCKVLRKDDTFVANLDKLGSIVWKNCDGVNTVKQILEILKTEFPDAKNIDQRLFLYLIQMKNLDYIYY
jgi:hypothetical protein